MFTGIIEEVGEVVQLKKDKENIHITVKINFCSELRIDQSLAHNGVCLTVVDLDENSYTVTAIKETIDKSNFGDLKIGDKINLERAMVLGDRLDGHIVQGHVDQVAKCTEIKELEGSWFFTFEYDEKLRVALKKLEECIGKDNDYRADIASVLATRLANYTVFYSKENTIDQKIIDRLKGDNNE